MIRSAGDILNEARSWVSKVCKEGTPAHQEILDIYNNHRPLAGNYKVKKTDHWCMTFISMLFIRQQCVNLLGGTECSCGRAIEKMKKAGIWEEDGNITPKPGDIIFYDWDGTDGWPEHVGIVESVNGVTITVIEGNYKDQVGRRVINKGWKYIRGYARPKYSKPLDDVQFNSPKKSIQEVAKEVIQGAWGSGAIRISGLKKAGYDPDKVQEEVNRQIGKPIGGFKTVQVAKEVLEGKWGNGQDRTNALKKAGHNPELIQQVVNNLLRDKGKQ